MRGTMQIPRDHLLAVSAELEAIQGVLRAELPHSAALGLAPETLCERAGIAFEWGVETGKDLCVAKELLAVELLAAARGDLIADIPAARRTVSRLEEQAGVHPAVIARGLLRAPEVLAMAPTASLHTQLALIMALGPIDEASVWRRDQEGTPQRLAQAGAERAAGDEVLPLADAMLRDERSSCLADRDLLAMRLVDSEERAAVIVCRADPIFHGRVRGLLAESVPMLAAMFDRERLIARAVEIERSMSEARDRRLARLGLDVHDGPLQDLAALGQDIGLFRRQLDTALDGSERRQVLLGRIDDLEAQLIAADAEIRRLAVSLQSPFLAHHDFRRALEEVTTAFEVAAGLTPQVALTGELGAISDSQQMALLTIVREALGNVREHSGATEVQVSVAVDADAVRAELWDNGTGFDVETTLVRAARSGRLGLVGMLERVRLLDGTSRFDSRPGGPTTLSISLPRWQQ